MRSLTTFADPGQGEGPGRLIPRPEIPVQPVLSWDTFFSNDRETVPAVVDRGRVLFVTAARMAIAHALELSGIAAGQKVLVPAYHCSAMVEPVVHFGAKPVFYALKEDLSVDFTDIERLIDADTRILMAVNYFGFPQNPAALRRFCDDRGLIFIEDCAHSFFGSYGGQPLGSFGHFAVASLTKFYPVRDGGCLVIGATREEAPVARLRSQSFGANAAAAFDTVEEAVEFRRLGALAPIVRLVERLKHRVRTWSPEETSQRWENPAQLKSGQKGGFDPRWIDVRGSAVSQAVQRHASRSYIVERRRYNYQWLANEFSGRDRCRPLFASLQDGVVPYMFPLWIDDLSDIFATLEDRAVPMQRFGQFPWTTQDKDTDKVTARLARELIQLPCHQTLTEEEIATLARKVRDVVG